MSDAPATNEDTPIEDILPIAIQSPHPVAVVDDTGKLVGEISQGTLLQVLASDLEESGEEPPATDDDNSEVIDDVQRLPSNG